MGISDLIIGAIYLVIFLLIGVVIKRQRYKDVPEGKYFMWGLLIKMGGAVALGVIYHFYYPWGDTYTYFAGGHAWANAVLSDPGAALDFLLNPVDPDHARRIKQYNAYPKAVYIFRGSTELHMLRITGVLALLGAKTYISTAILFAFISFTGAWAMYRTFLMINPGMEKGMAWACFLVPSVVLWGSGILKDTVTLGCIGWITYTVFRIFLKGDWRFRNLLFLGISVYFTLHLKGYILLAFFPAISLWVFMTYRSRISSQFLRKFSLPIFLGIGILSGALLVDRIGESLGKYNLENLETTAEATRNWHLAADEGGANYSLGYSDFSLTSIIRTIPAAVNVTLFRPYPWEASGGISYITALESFVILLLTIYVFFKGILRKPSLLLQDPFVLFCLVFTIIFGTAVGFTSNNFGALARYKIPCIPFYAAMLVTLYYKVQEIKRQKRLQANAENDPVLKEERGIPARGSI